MIDVVALKHLGKLGEEAGELQSAACRCIIQGIDEKDPGSGKVNREWLEDEIADVLANAELCMAHFKLDRTRIGRRATEKRLRLMSWHKGA